MPIDAYSPCPGGTGNKIKFCCPDLLGDLQKIGRMLEGEQYQASLRHIEQLEKSNPDRACLLALKTLLLRTLGRIEEANATTEAFLAKHPQNPIALAESAILAAMSHDAPTAMRHMLAAVAETEDRMQPRVYEAIDSLTRFLLADGEVLPARALATMQAGLAGDDDRRPLDVLMRLSASPNVPLVVKDARGVREAPDDVPWKAEADEVKSLTRHARWTEAAERFAELAERVGGHPVLWWNLATLRGWLADVPGCIDALERYAASDVPWEDAVEAEALALFLSDDPLGDRQEVFSLRYRVDDVNRVQAALQSAPTTARMEADPAQFANEGSPPPRALFAVFDGEVSDLEAEITLENVSRLLAHALLYGKQTDREARLEVVEVTASDLDSVKNRLAEAAGDALPGEPEQEVMGHISTTRDSLNCRWRLPTGFSQQDLQRLIDALLHRVLLETWPQAPSGLLNGKSPQEAAADEAYRVKVAAAMMVLRFWLDQIGASFDLNRLRARLGIPELEPIDPEEVSLEELPLPRLSRLVVEKLSDEALLSAYKRALGNSARDAAQRFARAVVDRPSLEACQERLLAFEMMATGAEDSDEALRYVDEGRKLALQAGQSCAHWDMLELPMRFERGEAEEASRLFEHLQTRHAEEPGVARALTELLIELGILNPDGSPAAPMQRPAAEAPSLVVPEQGGAKPGELWTPDSQKPAGEKAKIWTPGME